MLSDLFAAIALMLVIEGMLPFLSPSRFRETLLGTARFDNRTLRAIGLASMAGGVILLYLVR